MNIFKKTFNLNLFKRVELRVMDELKKQIPKEKKDIYVTFSLGVPIFSFITFGSYWGVNFINNLGKKDFLLMALDLLGTFGIILGGAVLFALILASLIRLIKLFHISLNFSYNNKNYYELISSFHLEEMTELTSEEIKELLSMPLNDNQVNYLQKCIIQHNVFNLENLHRLSELLTDEELLEKKNNESQQKLNDFILEHELDNSESSYMVLNNHNQLKKNANKESEINLTARL